MIALPRIVNYTRSARSIPTRPGDAPFHPLCGQDFEFVAYRQNWGEDRVHLHDEDAVVACSGADPALSGAYLSRQNGLGARCRRRRVGLHTAPADNDAGVA
jgi:hypothetical protein